MTHPTRISASLYLSLLALPFSSVDLTAQTQRYLSSIANGISAVATEPGSGAVIGVNQLGTGPMKTYRWDSGTWVGLTNTGPTARVFQAMAGEPGGGVVLFGGQPGAGGTLPNNFTWLWNGTSWATVAVATSPRQRSGSAAGQLPIATGINNAVIFGGTDSVTGALLGDTWMFNGTNWLAVPGPGPSPRFGATMTSNGTSGLILFGGIDVTGFVADTWLFNGTTWTQLFPTTSPSARALAGMASDVETTLPFSMPRAEVIMSSGLGTNGPLTDVWTFQAGNWIPQGAMTGTIINGLATGATDTVHREAVFVGTGALAAFVVGKFGFTAYAFGCACPNNATPILSGSAVTPQIGNTITYNISNGIANSFIFLAFSSTPAAIPITPACNLWVGAGGSVLVGLNGIGAGSFPFAIPNVTGIIGTNLYHQAVDPFVTCGSNGLETRVGR